MTLVPLDQHDPRLRQVCAPMTRTLLKDRQQQLEIEAVLGFVYGGINKTQPGAKRDPKRPTTVGLAGNQVGIMKQVCVVDLSIGHQGYSDVYVLVNPRITWWSKSIVEKPEGCVNFPTIWGITRRSRSVRVSAIDRSGNKIELKLDGWPAVLLQHEIDHLYGRLFIDRLPDTSRAHHVPREEYVLYRQTKPEKWTQFVDVTREAIPLPEGFQAGPHDGVR